MISATELKDELFAIAVPGKREVLAKFFKTGPGEYGEGDLFIGIPVPQQRALVKQYKEMLPNDIAELLADEFHECRMIALFFLVRCYQQAESEEVKKAIFNFYINHTKHINNWDLVDLSAPSIVGDFLYTRKRDLLYELIESSNMWDQRIAIVSTITFIRKGDFNDTFQLCNRLMSTKIDLLQKAMGWMLREIGKKDYQQAFDYLKSHYKEMPRTMLRYAIERYDEDTRKAFLKGTI